MARKNKGKAFEQVVHKAFLQVSDVSIDRLRDAPRKLKGVDNPSDFIVYKMPHELYVECKSHHGNTLPFSCIREEQINGMIEKSKIEGVKCGVIVWFIDHDLTVWYPIELVVERILALDKSLNVKDVDLWSSYVWGVDKRCIVIHGTKKRVYFDYDMQRFLEDLYQ